MKRATKKTLLALAIGAFATSTALAQIPRTISFQGVLADAQGVLVPDGNQQLTIAIYDQATGGTALFSETLTVPVVRGVFNAIIGSSNPSGIPANVSFDNQYYLGVRVGTGAELAPRTPFTSVPYALNAAVAQRAITAQMADTASFAFTAINADTAGTIRGGYVTSLNGQQGAIEFLGAGATTVTRNGNQFIIRSTDTSGGAIRRIDNFDGSLVIDPPTGPFVTMFIREQGVQTHHLRDLSITTAKIIDQQITTRTIADGAVTNSKLGALSISNDKIQTGAVDSRTILDGTIVTADLADNSVTSPKIVDGQVLTQDIGDLQVTTAKLADNSVTSVKIVDGEVMTQDIGDLQVTNGKLAADAVTTDKILDGTIGTNDIADNAVTAAKIGTLGAPAGTFLQSDGSATPIWSNDGSQIQNLNASNITSGTLDDARLSTNVPLKNGNNLFTGTNEFDGPSIFDGSVTLNGGVIWNGPLDVTGRPNFIGDNTDNLQLTVRGPGAGATTNQLVVNGRASVAGTLTAGFLVGDGSGLTNLNATNITTGTLNDARLSTNVALLNNAQTFTGAKTFNAPTTFNGTAAFNAGLTGTTLALSGKGTSASTIAADPGNTLVTKDFVTTPGNVAVATNATLVGDGTIGNPLGINLANANTWTGAQTFNAATTFGAAVTGTTFTGTTFTGGTFNGTHVGDGAGLTNLNASNIATGTLNDARLSTNVALLNNAQTFTGAKTFNAPTTFGAAVTGTTFTGTSFTGNHIGDGSLLTNLNASNITSGTLNDARLSTNVPLLNAANTFTNTNTFGTINVTTANGGTFNGTFVGDGSSVTNINADNIATGTLDLARIDAAGAAAGQSLTYDGANVIWGNPAASSLVMPFAQTATEATTMFSLTNNDAVGAVSYFQSAGSTPTSSIVQTGTGSALMISSTNAGAGSALTVGQNSTAAPAASFTTGAGSAFPTVTATATGTGAAIYGLHTGVGSAITGQNNGSGPAVSGLANSGTGVVGSSVTGTAGSFSITNAANGSTALSVTTAGAGTGVSSIVTSGTAVAATSVSGAGVSATSTSGAGLSASSTNGNAVNATSVNGVGVSAISTNGPGLAAATNVATQYAATFTGGAAGSNGISITAGAGGTAINITAGSFIGSYGTVASGGTIANDVMVVEVQDDGIPASTATATLPLVATNGQIIIVGTNDPDGAIVNGAGFTNTDARRYTFIGGAWVAEF